MADWERLAGWWLEEIADDPIYGLDVVPLAIDLAGRPTGIALDLGCGEGQVMRAFPGRVVGTDISQLLLQRALSAGPVVRGRLPDLDWIRTAAIDTAYAVLVLEHLPDLNVFGSAFRVVRPGGKLVMVANHPSFTAAEAGPIVDQTDGEFLWRWGDYFNEAEIAMHGRGKDSIAFHHRPLGTILNAAADSGWMLDCLTETGFSDAAIAVRPGYAGQEQMPRLLGIRWIRSTTGSDEDHHSR